VFYSGGLQSQKGVENKHPIIGVYLKEKIWGFYARNFLSLRVCLHKKKFCSKFLVLLWSKTIKLTLANKQLD